MVIVASLLSTYILARRNQQNDVESQATVVADNAGAGLAFGDRQVVDEIVGALDVRPNIDMVCVYDKAERFSAVSSAGLYVPISVARAVACHRAGRGDRRRWRVTTAWAPSTFAATTRPC